MTRLFLSSYRFGKHQDEFVRLTGNPGPIAVIGNAADAWPPAAREASMTSEMGPLRALGYRPVELDLRKYIGRTSELERRLDAFDAVWVRGGNTFVLRAQLARSGGDRILQDRVLGNSITYAGYSAGACVASPTLQGVDDADDPAEVRSATGIDALWSGLGLVDFSIVPHLDSPLDETDSAQLTLERLRGAGVDAHGLTDEQAIVVDKDGVRLL